MSSFHEELVILEPGNGGDSDIEGELDELYGDDTNLYSPSDSEEEPLDFFTDINWEVTNSICEGGSTLEEEARYVEMDTRIISKGLLFESKEDLQLAVKKYCVKQHYQITVIESNRDIWYVKCKQWNEGCRWRLRACRRKTHGMFEITKLEGEHSCLYPELTQDHSQLDSDLMCNEVQNLVRRDPGVKISVLQETIKKDFGYSVNYRRVWQAKRKAIIKVFGDWEKSYEELPYWVNALVHYNTGTQIQWDLIPSDVPGHHIFGRIFWSFAPAIEGFKYCIPMIQIDGTHLYGKYKGKLLIATSMDTNGQSFPLAFAIVEEENTSSWSWFLRTLRALVTQRESICLISDRHGGIIAAVKNEENGWSEPRAYHRYCLRHVASNFNNKYKSKQLKALVSKAGRQHQRRKFERCMKELKRLNPDCLEFFSRMKLEKWTQSHDNGHRYGWMTTNLAESINGVFKGARMLPITALVKLTWYRTILYFEKRREKLSEALDRGDIYTEYALTKLRRWERRASSHTVKSVDRETHSFEIETGISMISPYKGQQTQVVSLGDRTCTCNKWQSFKIPCSHVIAACHHIRLAHLPFVDDAYKISQYKRCFEVQFHPIQHKDYWPEVKFDILHPNKNLLREHGRPKSSRIHNEMDWREASTKIRCGVCKREGHNKRTCPSRNLGASSSHG